MNERARERMEVYELRDRRIRLAMKHLKSSRDLLYAVGSDREPLNLPVAVSYWQLLEDLLDTANEIVEALEDEFFGLRPMGDAFGLVTQMGGNPAEKVSDCDQSLEDAEKLVAAIKARRGRATKLELIGRLENTDGRTAEEAELYRAKAASLRAAMVES